MRLRMLTLLLPVALAGCLGLGCPCGSDPADPLSEHDLSFAGSHVLDEACACRCGEDPPVSEPLAGRCEDLDGPCVDRAGASTTRVCR